jgi:hypothetical protein
LFAVVAEPKLEDSDVVVKTRAFVVLVLKHVSVEEPGALNDTTAALSAFQRAGVEVGCICLCLMGDLSAVGIMSF